MKKLQIFNQNHCLTPLAKCKFCPFFNSTFLLCRTANFLCRTLQKTFYGSIWSKKQRINKFQIVDHNHGLTPLEKFKFCHFFNLTFWLSKKANFLSRTSWKTFMGLFRYFYRLEWLIFNLEHHERLFQCIWSKKQRMKKSAN